MSRIMAPPTTTAPIRTATVPAATAMMRSRLLYRRAMAYSVIIRGKLAPLANRSRRPESVRALLGQTVQSEHGDQQRRGLAELTEPPVVYLHDLTGAVQARESLIHGLFEL